jgi:hypothetical protein
MRANTLFRSKSAARDSEAGTSLSRRKITRLFYHRDATATSRDREGFVVNALACVGAIHAAMPDVEMNLDTALKRAPQGPVSKSIPKRGGFELS